MHTRIEDIILLNREMVATISGRYEGANSVWEIEFVNSYWRSMFSGIDYTGKDAIRGVAHCDLLEWIRPECLIGKLEFSSRSVKYMLWNGSH